MLSAPRRVTGWLVMLIVGDFVICQKLNLRVYSGSQLHNPIQYSLLSIKIDW